MLADAFVLFDIDGTLIRRAGPHHRQALVDAVRHVTGLETTTDHIPLHGMLDPDILSRMMQNVNAPASTIRHSMPAIIRHAQWSYVRSCPDLRRKTCPGVRQVLNRLREHGVPMALVTGNLTRIGWKKMERAGLKSYFSFGAFGETAPDRTGLARNAIRHARHCRLITPQCTIALIGDAPADIIAAKANGIRSIAVRTGISPVEELRALHPDYLLGDLRELDMKMITGEPAEPAFMPVGLSLSEDTLA